MPNPSSELDELQSELDESLMTVLELLNEEGSMRISEIASRLDEDHEEVRAVMNALSKKHVVASSPNFEYEYVGKQEQKKPTESRA